MNVSCSKCISKKRIQQKLTEKYTEFHRAKHNINKLNNYFDYNVNSKRNRKFNDVNLTGTHPHNNFNNQYFNLKSQWHNRFHGWSS